jgi:CRP-like cAMP-binding protein
MVSASNFRRFVPTSSLHPSDWTELAKASYVASFKPGQVLFHRGEAARTVVFLLAGKVELVSEQGVRSVQADTEEARHALAEGARRAATGTCMEPAEALFVDRDKLDVMLTWAQTGEVEVREWDADDDWMSILLRHPALHRIPPGNIAQILACVEQVEVLPGEVVLRQGDAGDYYYVVTSGECAVLRAPDLHSEAVEVDRIRAGGGFGEEALVSGEPRNATVRALSRSRLVRLSAADFRRLLQEPMLSRVTLKTAPANAQWVDVRTMEEFQRGSLPDASCLPLRDVRTAVGQLDPRRPVVVFCDTGRRSASATFLLSERGFTVAYVEGGVTPDHFGATSQAASAE